MLQTAIQWLSLFLMFEVIHIRQYLLLYKLSPFSGCPLIQARVSFISEKHSNKNNEHNWHGCLACVPEQKGVGSRFAACLEGQHGCSSLEGATSHLFPAGSCLGWYCPDPSSHVSNMSRMSVATLVVSTAVDLFAGSSCPFSYRDAHQSRVGQAPPSDIRNLQWQAGQKGAWHTLVDTYVWVEGFLCGFHPVLFLLALSLISYCI